MNRRTNLAVALFCLLLAGACSPPASEEVEATSAEQAPEVNVVAEETPDSACESDADCAEEEFCQFPIGECGGAGICEVRPQICTMDYRPVCGCDDETYGNACNAAGSGVSVRSEGECG